MSRLFDALNRVAPETADDPRTELWKDLKLENPVQPPATAQEVVFADDGTPLLRLSEEHEVPRPIEHPPAAAAPVEAADAPSGKLIKISLDTKARLIPYSADPIVVEHYRRLRTRILQQQAEKHFRSLVITSASPQEGKTVTVLNLALSFAMLPSFKILVVDADLRRGTLGSWFGVDPNLPGLNNLLDGSATREDVIFRCDGLPLYFVMRGNSKSRAAELLNSPKLAEHMRNLGEGFDLMLVDSAPINLVTDAQLLAGSCDAVALLARAFSTSRKSLEKAAQDLQPFRVIGTILNASTPTVSRGYGRYTGYY
jgi:capsular exopolysaccharide synthesis family protein